MFGSYGLLGIFVYREHKQAPPHLHLQEAGELQVGGAVTDAPTPETNGDEVSSQKPLLLLI